MPKTSSKENKSIYQITREELGLSREKASELMHISHDKLEKIESGKQEVQPEDVLFMSEAYEHPELCNFYCAHECPIGQNYVPEIKMTHLSQIVLEMLASLNTMDESKNKLIEITSDGEISDNELADFAIIQENLTRISVTVESLRLWTEKMIASGKINEEKLDSYKKSEKK